MEKYIDKRALTKEDRKVLKTAIRAGMSYADLGCQSRTLLSVSFRKLDTTTHKASYKTGRWEWVEIEK